MKKSDFDFSIPNRQSYVAIILILFKTVNVLFRQLLPAIVVVMIGGSKNKSSYILYFIIAVALLSMIYSLVNFFKTYFLVQDGELILHTGVFSKKKMSIPFNKIQTINFEQNLVHQIFSVLRIKVDTAGSEKNEFEFHALEAQKAYALRDLVMTQKSAQNDVKIHAEEADRILSSFKTIMKLSPKDLLKVGLTENHIRSGGLVFLFFFWIYQNLQEVGVDVDAYSEEIPDVDVGFGFIVFLGILMIVVSILISLVRTVISNYDLRFLRSDRGFKVVSGLFTKREVSAQDHKIQHISWSDNILRRIIGFKNLYLNQASSVEVTSKQNIKIPGCNKTHIQEVIKTLFGTVNLEDFHMMPIDKKYFIRFATLVSIFSSMLIFVFFYLGFAHQGILAINVIAFLLINRYISYRKKTFGHDGSLVYIKGGIFGEKAEILPIFKIQAIEINQSPYQTKHHLCNTTLYTAAGKITIPYINKTLATTLLDTFIQIVEMDRRKWM